METLLVRQVNAGALELSGREMQKLALARALYKDASLVVLDEPTLHDAGGLYHTMWTAQAQHYQAAG